jgi:hypothetical protein
VHLKLKQESQYQVFHCTNQIVDVDSNEAAEHHVEVEEASSKVERLTLFINC